MNDQHSNAVKAGTIAAVRCNERMRMVTVPGEEENECGGKLMRTVEPREGDTLQLQYCQSR